MQQTELLKAATQAWPRRADKGLTEVCLQKKSFHLGDGRGEERSDVVEIRAVMFHSGGT